MPVRGRVRPGRAVTTLAEFRADLRLRLNDPTSTRWSDVELTSYLGESTDRYSKIFPRVREATIPFVAGQLRYDLPADLIDRKVYRVWYDQPNLRTIEIPPAPFRARHSARWYDIVEDRIVFAVQFPAGSACRVRYGALHEMPAAGESSVPSEDHDLVYLWAEYLAWRKIGGADASLSRWKEQGNRADGPIIPHYVYLEKQYARLVEEKKAGGRFYTLRRAERTPRFDPFY